MGKPALQLVESPERAVTLDELKTRPELLDELSIAQLRVVLADAERLVGAARARWLMATMHAVEPIRGPDRLLTAQEAAVPLRVSVASVYRNAKFGLYPFVVPQGRRLFFSEHGLQDWLALRRKA